jgi:endonuclease III
LLPDGQDHAALQQHARKLVPKQSMFEFHWLLSRHASEVCRAEEPACDACGFRTDCRAGRDASKAAAKANKGSRK